MSKTTDRITSLEQVAKGYEQSMDGEVLGALTESMRKVIDGHKEKQRNEVRLLCLATIRGVFSKFPEDAQKYIVGLMDDEEKNLRGITERRAYDFIRNCPEAENAGDIDGFASGVLFTVEKGSL